MSIIVQKFGGTSTNTYEKRDMIQARVEQAKAEGHQVACVVSAMGRRGEPYATDTLLDLVLAEYSDVSLREMDMIAVCGEHIAGSIIAAHLQKGGHKACYLTGQQAGILTNGNYTESDLVKFDPSRLEELIAEGYTPLVGSGQGYADKGELCMLGRGGGDTSAAILGVGLQADETVIYTDVSHIMTADPRVVPNARKLESISYQNCADMAHNGAKVVHPRAVEIAAKRPEMALYIRGLNSTERGTLIGPGVDGEPRCVGAAAQTGDVLVEAAMEGELAQACINAGLELTAAQANGKECFVVSAKDARRFRYLMNETGKAPVVTEDLTRVSLIGDKLDEMDDVLGRICAQAEGGAIASRFTSGACSVWVAGDGKGTLLKVHKEFLEG